MVCDDILKDENLNQNNVLFEEIPKRPLKLQIIRPNKNLNWQQTKLRKNTPTPLKKVKIHWTKKWLKKVGYLDTSNQQTINYNNDANITDLETVDYNSDTNTSDLKDHNSIDTTNLKKHQELKLQLKKSRENIEKYIIHH